MKKTTVTALAVALTLAAGAALACQSKSDCSGGDTCCFGPWQDNGTWGSNGKSGACMPAKECYGDGGTSVLFDGDTQCGEGHVLCTVSTPNGSIRGCYPEHLCDK